MTKRPLGHMLTRFGEWGAHPLAFGVVLVYAVFWFFLERETFDWHAVATLSTWLMTLVITRSEYRDDQAINAKLDELLRAGKRSNTELKAIDELEPEDIEEHRHHPER